MQLSLQKRPPAQSDLIASAGATYLHRTARKQPSSREPWQHLIFYLHLSDSPPLSLTYFIVSWTSNFCIFLKWKLQAHPPRLLFLFCLSSSWLQAVKGKWVNTTRWSSVEATGQYKTYVTTFSRKVIKCDRNWAVLETYSEIWKTIIAEAIKCAKMLKWLASHCHLPGPTLMAQIAYFTRSSSCFIFPAGSESEVAALQEIAWRCIPLTLPHPCFWPPTPATLPHLHLLIKPEDVTLKSHLPLWGFTCFYIQSILSTNPNSKL